MILNDFSDVSRELDLIRRRLAAIEAQLRARLAEPDDDGAAIDAMIGRQLDALEKAMVADLAFEDERPVRAVRSARP